VIRCLAPPSPAGGRRADGVGRHPALCATFSRGREKGWIADLDAVFPASPPLRPWSILPAAPASARMAGPPAPIGCPPGSDGRPRPGQRPACLPTHGPHMNFHEYQAKQLFADYGIAVPAGRVARTPEE